MTKISSLRGKLSHFLLFWIMKGQSGRTPTQQEKSSENRRSFYQGTNESLLGRKSRRMAVFIVFRKQRPLSLCVQLLQKKVASPLRSYVHSPLRGTCLEQNSRCRTRRSLSAVEEKFQTTVSLLYNRYQVLSHHMHLVPQTHQGQSSPPVANTSSMPGALYSSQTGPIVMGP